MRLLLPLLASLPVVSPLMGAEPPAPAKPLEIRGTLPWHNFLSGPSAWNEEDYRVYLDRMRAAGLNLVVFHNYTGGTGRYAPYVEPMIRMPARGILPEATFDTSLTARWGYRPLRVSEFAFETGRLFRLPPGADAFGADCMLLARDNEDRYRRAQALMRRVMEMAHQRGIRFAMGFEFGIHPPEHASILPKVLPSPGGVITSPDDPFAREVLYDALDDILRAYPGIDQIWLWHQELNGGLGFDEIEWSAAYLNAAHDYLKRVSPATTIVLSGWGGAEQLPRLLTALDGKVPKDIVFSCLNPDMGGQPHPPVLAEIARNRTVWAIPWLEGDWALWHLQPRVNAMRDHVRKAAADGLHGAVAIHWRTEETRLEFETFAAAARDPAGVPDAAAIYQADATRRYGEAAARILAPAMLEADTRGLLPGARSPEYLAYDPLRWVFQKPENAANYQRLLKAATEARGLATTKEQAAEIDWLADNLRFALHLDATGRAMQAAWLLREQWLLAGKQADDALRAKLPAARAALDAAPIRELFECYSRKIRSRGELGVLSSLNQRVWLEYQQLRRFLDGLP